MRRILTVVAAVAAATLSAAAPALACGGLIGPNGAVNLIGTTTLAAYHDGVEHYVTAFKFVGSGAAFGSIVPLPGAPSNVERGGAWTLQRLVRETNPPILRAAVLADAASTAQKGAEILLQTRIDALDITVLRGGGGDVGIWAKEHDFRLPPDAPEVLDFYAQRSPIFLAAVFDGAAAAARGQNLGDGTPVHITIPTDNPWVPLRILALGKSESERVAADVYLLTDRKPALLPFPGHPGLLLDHSAPARKALLDDLRSDAGMSWVPQSAWLTKVRVDAAAAQLKYDLAVDASGADAPSRVAAGFEPASVPDAPVAQEPLATAWAMLVLGAYLAVAIALVGYLVPRPRRAA